MTATTVADPAPPIPPVTTTRTSSVTTAPGRVRWATPAVVVLMLAAGTVYALGIKLGLIHNYYGPAVYSMAHSWKAFFWGAFDGTSITLDKIPGAFWIQALSVRIFGWSTRSVLMPQVLQAVAAIGVIHLTVRRWAGDVAGVLAALALAVTPVLAALAHSQIVDTQLLLLSVCAAWAWTHAVQKGSGWWLALAGVFVGMGFNAKMAQAWGILPALAITYLLFAPTTRAKRWLHTLVAGVVTLVSSLWWVIIASLVPANSRPWIDGAADNSVWTMVFEYNLLGRYASGQGGPDAASGWAYLLSPDVATQYGWLLPAALVGLVVVLWDRHRAPRTDLMRAATVMWGVWLGTLVVAFSTGRVAHSFYTVALAPAIVALAATGAVVAWRAALRRNRWPMLAMLVPTLAWTAYLTMQYPTFHTWTLPVVIVLGALGAVLLFVRRSPMALRTGAAALVVSVLLTPAVWAASTMQSGYSGASIGPAAGPVQTMGGGPGGSGGPGGAGGQGGPQGDGQMPHGDGGQAQPDGAPQIGGQDQQGGASQGDGGQPPQGMTPPQGGPGMDGGQTTQASEALDYIAAHDAGTQYDVVVLGYGTAGSYIQAGGRVLSVGGFTGQMSNLTLSELQTMVAQKQVTYVLVDGGQGGPGGSGGPGGAGGTGSTSEITEWVTANGTEVDGYTGLYHVG